MPAVSPRSPISPRHSGFHQIDRSNSSSSSTMNGPAGDGIALQQVRSNGSTITGARRAPTLAAPDRGGGQVSDEKAGGHADADADAVHHLAGRRKRMTTGLVRQDSGDDVALNAMGRIYTRIVGFSPIMRYFVYVAPVALLLAVPLIVLPLTDHRTDLLVGSQQGAPGPPLFQLFVWIEVSWLSLWLGKIAASTFPAVFMFFCGVVSPGTRKYANVIRALEVPISLFIWALVAWLVFRSLFLGQINNGVVWVHNVERILASLLASSGVYLGEKAIVQLIAVSYHQRSFALRIKESKREIHLLGLLYDASRTLFPMYCREFEEEDYVINDSIEMQLQLLGRKGGRGGASTGHATPMRLIGDVGRFGDKVTSVFGNLASEITGKKVFNPNSAHSVVVEALEKIRPSEALARRVWMSFVVEGREALYLDDFKEVLGPVYKDEAEEAFGAIDSDANGDISLDEMVRKVVDMGRERKAINEGMKDISQALRVFDKVLLFVVLLIVVLIFLAFFQSSLVTTIGTAATALLSLSFVFAVTTQEFLGSCIFLFVKHPFDVGDRVDIANGGEKMNLSVDKISLLYTVFTRIDKMQVVQIPNIVLTTLWIENVSRSKAMKEVITVNVSFDTTLDDIELLRLEIEQFVRHPDNSREFQPDIVVGVGGVGDLDMMELKIAIKHKSNWHNDAVRATRRSKFMCALLLALKKVPIYGPGGGGEALGAAGNPSYSVAVSDQIAAGNRARAERDKEAKRMVSSRPTGSAVGIEAEWKAAGELNAQTAAQAAYEGFGYDKSEENTSAAAAAAVAQERRRSVGIESIRNDLRKTASQSGRRRPGEGIGIGIGVGSGTALSEVAGQGQQQQPNVTLSPSSSVRRAGPVFDEEAEAGLGRAPSGASNTGGGSNRSYYTAYPPQGASYGGGAAGIAQTLHPLHSAPAVVPLQQQQSPQSPQSQRPGAVGGGRQ